MPTTLSHTVEAALVPRPAPGFVRRALDRFGRLDELESLYAGARASGGALIPALLNGLDVRLEVADEDLLRIPQAGSTLVVHRGLAFAMNAF